MTVLDHRIPPPLLALVIALLMWLSTRWLPDGGLPPLLRNGAALLLLVAGVSFSLPAVRSFRRAGTTVNPVRIENASELVTGGMYAISRNPMYVGVTLVLCAVAFLLGNLWTLAGPIAFVAYITRFQIIPEEKLLTAKFGETYREYCRRVRRWL